MAANKFVLEIEIGNDAMKLPQHIAEALAAIAKQVPSVIMMKGVRAGASRFRPDRGGDDGGAESVEHRHEAATAGQGRAEAWRRYDDQLVTLRVGAAESA